ncbi:hypothetical protein DB347_18635 [Opitutaceae bacterium EW11]|nr:hypothetical protein DB347_18635 [Opitutaceae bacterium EW11]
MSSEKSPSILVIDDNDANRYTISRYLARQGWEVMEARTGAEGLELARKLPSVVILDVSLPDIIGYDVCKMLRANPETRAIPVLHVSASFTNSDDVAFGLDQGADAFLTEPIDPKELVATVRALMRLRSAESRAEANFAQLEAVINSMVEGVVTADRRGNILKMNRSALAIYGFSHPNEFPRSLDDQERQLERTYLDGRPIPRSELPIVRAARGETVSNFEMRVRRRGTDRWWIGSFNATPVRSSEEGEGLVIVTAFDITERKHADAALAEAQATLQRYADQLEQMVVERTSSLQDAISQMEEFSYTVSHDLRAPLRSIKGYAEVLVQDYAHRLRGEGARYLERIIENGNRMERLVNDVLTLSRISNAKLKLEPVPLQPIVEAVLREYPNLQSGMAHITIDPMPVVIGHESLCTQVFSNLLGNAAKFVRPGTHPEIRVTSERQDGSVRVRVKDNGIGISPEFHAKIFGMFERLDPENRYGGTGIGLAIVRRAVEKMNGRVGVESDGHSGSCFWVELPAADGNQ